MADGPPMVAIKEANVHLQALHERNVKLEHEVRKLQEMLSLREQQEQRLLGQQQIIKEKDDKIHYLEKEVNRLFRQSQENLKKDLLITQLGRKVKLLNEILKYKSALESITVCLDQVEEDFIVDIDNMVQVMNANTSAGGQSSIREALDVSKLSDINHETNL